MHGCQQYWNVFKSAPGRPILCASDGFGYNLEKKKEIVSFLSLSLHVFKRAQLPQRFLFKLSGNKQTKKIPIVMVTYHNKVPEVTADLIQAAHGT